MLSNFFFLLFYDLAKDIGLMSLETPHGNTTATITVHVCIVVRNLKRCVWLLRIVKPKYILIQFKGFVWSGKRIV